jgi:hypothetical protein
MKSAISFGDNFPLGEYHTLILTRIEAMAKPASFASVSAKSPVAIPSRFLVYKYPALIL